MGITLKHLKVDWALLLIVGMLLLFHPGPQPSIWLSWLWASGLGIASLVLLLRSWLRLTPSPTAVQPPTS